MRFPLFQESRIILLYASLPSEPDLLPLLESFLGEKIFVFPLITPKGLSLRPVGRVEELVMHGKLREPDPTQSRPLHVGMVDLALVPGLAFGSKDGSRLGRGGGYYDRLLADPDFSAFTIGVCFHEQLCLQVPRETHDIAVRTVLTQHGLA